MHLMEHPVIQQLFDKNIPFEVHDAAVYVDGFSKSGSAKLMLEGEALVCHTRYDRRYAIEQFDDLVNVAFTWWSGYRDRSPFETPSEIWAPHFLERGWIKAVVNTTYTPA